MIRARHSGQYLDVNNAATTANADLVQSFYNGGTNQQFRLTDAGGGYYYLEPVHASGMVLSAQGTTSDNLTKVTQQAKDAGKDNQKFKFVKISNGTYRIVSKVNENNGFNVAHISYTQGAAVICHGYIGGTNEQWILEECSDFIHSTMTYTADGRNAATSTDSRGKTTTNTYDSKNRLLTAVTDANGHTTNYTYDPNNDRLTSVSATVGDQTVTNSYTYTNDKLTSISHNGFNYNFAYDVFGNVTSTSVGNQVLSSNTYLPHNGLLSSSTYGNGATISNVYDKNYNIIQKKYNGESAFKYTYDAYGNTVRHEDLLNQVNYSYNYDMIGRLVGMNSSLGQSLRISYDNKNRMDYVVSKVGDTSTKTQYVYGDVAQQQKAGLIYGVKIDDKDTVTYTYDNLARISARTLNLTTPFTTSYSYLSGDKAGSTTTMVGSVNNNGNSLIYTYDNLGNIATISEKTSTGSVTQKAKYTYDELSQLVREDNKYINKTITYQYDVGGNLLSKKEYAYTTGTLGTVKKTISYAYGDTNWKDKLTSYNGQAITYDEIGNPLTYRDGMSFTWQNGRQMATLTNGSTSMSFKYDDSGIRTQKTVNGTTTQFYLNGSDILTQITGNERFDFFYDDAGDLLGFKYGGNNYYYIRNLQNDIIGILDSAGTQVVSYVYDSWGKLASISGSAKDTIGVKNPFRYRGYYYDTESGLYYLNSRYYDPEIGRFLNADIIIGAISLQGQNAFQYCKNNPINMTDSSGNWPRWMERAGKAVATAAKKIANRAITIGGTIAKRTGQAIRDINFTGASGISGGISLPLIDISGSIGIAYDTTGRISIHGGFSGGFSTNIGVGLTGTRYQTVSNCPSTKYLLQDQGEIGVSVAFPVYKGINAVGSTTYTAYSGGDSQYYGKTEAQGFGIGTPRFSVNGGKFEFAPALEWGDDYELFTINIGDVIHDIYIKIME